MSIKSKKIIKNITVDKLAEMVQRGFLDQSEKFDSKLKNFATKSDLKKLSATVTDLSATVTDLSATVTDLSATVTDLSATVTDLSATVANGFKAQEDKFATKKDFRNMEDQMLTGFDKILGKLDRIEQENIVHAHKHKIIEEMLKIRN